MPAKFFVDPGQINKSIITLSGSDVNHIKNVLRLKAGDEIDILDGKGHEYATEIITLHNQEIKTRIITSRARKSELKFKITLAQGLPKNPKLELIIQKCTELGVYKIIPTSCERSIVKIDHKKPRWEKIAQESAEQSSRLLIPEISSPAPFEQIISTKEKYDLKLILWEAEEKNKLKTIFSKHRKIENLLVLIGPEGGFTIKEVEGAKQNGFIPATLGKRILRTETAALAIMSMLIYEFES